MRTSSYDNFGGAANNTIPDFYSEFNAIMCPEGEGIMEKKLADLVIQKESNNNKVDFK